MMVRKMLLGLLFALLYALPGSAAFAQSVVTPDPRVDASGPNQLIETAANTMITELDTRRADFRKNPDRLYSLVERVLLPHFDVDYAGRLVLGKHYRAATPEQRKRFIDAFYGSLMGNYGDALLEFTGDRIKVLPTPTPADATAAVVRTEVKRSNGEKIPVNYVLRKGEQGWKAWDVVIEGVSYVKSFREDFGAEIDQKGLDAVIERLEAQHKNPRKPANGAK
ncbi:MAG: ABC transporter substrate-binding protein [Gammaproteobacteria bacterium]|jgi:phospholipid transport system substrate-binding protein|nr:ABC transporter substrate-binding protein [Gammaproteobacteria bacterium]